MHWRQRRSAEVASAVARLLTTSAADVTHERVSEEAGLPVGYLRWAYATRADLLGGAAARLPSHLAAQH